MMSDSKRDERITWLMVEFEQSIERYLHGNVDARQLAHMSDGMSSADEIETLSDELLQHTYWAMQHASHRPACWAPTRDELEYLLLCLREEEEFAPERVEFVMDKSATMPPRIDG